MTDFSERLAALSPEQRALFELRRKQKGLSEAQNQAIPRRKPAPYYPLSFDQMRLWFLYQLAPDNSAYNINGVVRLTGALNIEVVERSINEIIRRHEILRTTIGMVDEQPVQVIAPKLSIKLTLVDLRHLSEAEQAVEIPKVVSQYALIPFDLVNGPLIRTTLIRLAEEDHILLTTMHHIVTDRWSYTLYEQELAILYHAFSNRLPSPLPDLPIQFADFAIWQQQWMQSEKIKEQLAFWKRQLADLPPVHGLPTDHPRPVMLSFRGARQYVELSSAAVAGIKALSKQSGATLFITLLTIFKVLIARQSGQTDIVVGTPIANRGRPELEKVIGFFLNTLIFRSDLANNPTFREYLAQVREIASAAYAHQDVPFERLVAELRPERDTSRNPLYQISFLFLDFEDPQELSQLQGMKVTTVEVEGEDARFDLTLALWIAPDKIYGNFEYSTDLFEPTTIAAFAEHFKLLVEQIAANPEQRIFDIPCLTDAERQMLLVDRNATAIDYPQDRCVHQLIEAQAARTPEATAVVFEDRSLTYAALDARANQLAQHLRAIGVGPETRVGLYLHRSPDLVVALLGILKAGGAYVPLDPTYPTARVQFMLDDAAIRVLVTQQSLVDSLNPEVAQARQIVCLDADWTAIAQRPTTPPTSALTADHLAYIIYTSGSTGQPKGVAILHRALVNFLHAMRREPGIQPDDTLLAVTTLAFDIAGLELFLPLLVGAKLVVASREEAADGARLAALLDTSGATLLQATPATWRMLLAAGWTGTPGLRALCGGEALPWDLAETLLDQVDQLWNLYGPTETTIWSAATRVLAEDRRISLGRPIANTQIYLLDRKLQPVPLGATGELCIGGDGLARGYLNRPDLTADRFVPDPFAHPKGTRPGARLYRTGDVARYHSDGTIEFVGRIDHQVKVRGYRIELGEIEAVLRQHEAVCDAAVIVREDRPGDQRIVAYVVEQRTGYPRAGDKEQRTEGVANNLRALLRQRLPEYMVPSAFVFLDALPLTPSGKVDRKALPAPELQHTDDDGVLVAPRTPTEELIAGVWSSALGVSPIGVHDNFFTLGGHSLLATQIIGRLKQLLDLDLPLRLLFEAPTIATFAARLAAQQADAAVPLRPVARDDTPLPLSFAQQRLWFLDQLQPNSAAYNLLTVARLQGALDLAALRRSLTTIVHRHEVLRTSFTQHVPGQLGEPVQIIAPASDVPLSVVSLLDVPEVERQAALAQLVSAEAQRPFDLQQGPLIRAQIVQISAIEHVLLLAVHHIVSDGWSQGILLRELTTLYRGFVQHESVLLPELPIQYADYAVWQRQWLQGALLEQQIDYWRHQLAELPPLDLPTDYPRPPILTSHGAHTSFQIPASLSADLHHLSHQLGSTLFMTLLAAFQTLLSRYSGQDDIAVGTPIAGRTRPELEDLIGCFVNTLVLRTNLGGRPSFADVVKRVRAVCLQAYAHQDLPFEVVVERLQPQRDLSRTPLFQVMFALQNMPSAAISLPDLILEPIAAESSTAQFDLSFALIETSDGIHGQVEYHTDLFAPETIARLIAHYQALLAAVAADPEQPIDRLLLLNDTEQRQLLVEWNATAHAFPQGLGLHQLVEAQVARTPDAIAVVFEDHIVTYQELNRRANQLAHHLCSLGVAPEVLVGICVERSVEMVVGILGILKVGGAYVPLDPAFPRERLAQTLADAQPKVLLTQHDLIADLPAHQAQVVCLDTDWLDIAQQPTYNLMTAVTATNLAYVIYTSGSTGKPKGVQIQHGSVVNFLHSMQQQPGLTAHDVLLSVTTLSFDIAGLELFLPLSVGARIELVSREVAIDGTQLYAKLIQSGTTVMQATPATWRILIEAGWHHTPFLKVLCGGEALPLDLAHQILDRNATLWNLYGPTETTIWSTTTEVTRHDAAITMGRPIANTQIYLLDTQFNPVPIGVPGELYIGGDGLSRGYLHRAALTAERFIPNAFSQKPGERLYATGDLARYRADGTIEYLGRIDHQIKLRGFRIELGDIEAAIGSHPAVQETVVVAREDVPGEKRLVAYLVPNAHYEITEDLLAESQAEHISDWQQVYDDNYRQPGSEADETFDIAIWNSSYTGTPIPAEEMQEQVDQVVARVLAQKPQRVLEIGCGTGLLLFRIAPHCTHYCGTDFSAPVLQALEAQVQKRNLTQVRLLERVADNLADIDSEPFDVVLINSVVQYFPSADYLVTVLQQAVQYVRPGGCILVGDLRSYPLLETYHTSVQLYQATPTTSITQVRDRIESRVAGEEELLVDPTFFRALQQEMSSISQVEVQLRRGQYENELTKFRYDAILYVDREVTTVAAQRLDWQRDGLTLARVREILTTDAPAVLQVSDVPNARLWRDVEAQRLLRTNTQPATVGALLEALQSTGVGIDPEALWTLGAEVGYTTEVGWSARDLGRLQVIFRQTPVSYGVNEQPAVRVQPWHTYANNPVYSKLKRKLVPQVRTALLQQLPEYMVPSAFVVLDALPLTPNGKVDRKALPAPTSIKQDDQHTFVAPRTPLETHLAAMWADLLGLARVGINDNFFALGGHSLLATRVITRIRELFHTEVAVRALFEYPTIAELSKHIEDAQWSSSDPLVVVDPDGEEEEWEI